MNDKLIYQIHWLHSPNSKQMMMKICYKVYSWFYLPIHCNITEIMLPRTWHGVDAQQVLVVNELPLLKKKNISKLYTMMVSSPILICMDISLIGLKISTNGLLQFQE